MRALIVFALVCLTGCALQTGVSAEDNSSDMQAASSGEGSSNLGTANPAQTCSAASHLIINTPSGPVVVDIPANCVPTIGPDRGDPAPDYASDPNPWEALSKGNSLDIESKSTPKM